MKNFDQMHRYLRPSMLQHLLRRLVFDVPILNEYAKMPLKVCPLLHFLCIYYYIERKVAFIYTSYPVLCLKGPVTTLIGENTCTLWKKCIYYLYRGYLSEWFLQLLFITSEQLDCCFHILKMPLFLFPSVGSFQLLTNHYERCWKYYCLPNGWANYGVTSEEELHLSRKLFWGIFESLAHKVNNAFLVSTHSVDYNFTGLMPIFDFFDVIHTLEIWCRALQDRHAMPLRYSRSHSAWLCGC